MGQWPQARRLLSHQMLNQMCLWHHLWDAWLIAARLDMGGHRKDNSSTARCRGVLGCCPTERQGPGVGARVSESSGARGRIGFCLDGAPGRGQARADQRNTRDREPETDRSSKNRTCGLADSLRFELRCRHEKSSLVHELLQACPC
jgi:hypothetical protein